MRIGITGLSGLIGTRLATLAEAAGHEIIGFSRKSAAATEGRVTRLFDLQKPVDLSGLDAVVHLAGESIIGLWTAEKKRRIVASRRETTRHLLTSLEPSAERPTIFLSASGTGFYGDRGSEKLEENASHGHGFLAEVCQVWEEEAQMASSLGMRVCQLRTGMVLGRSGGAFPLLRRIFSLGLGGKLGNGEQFMPWIHLDDIAGLYLHCLENSRLAGPINAVAPQETTNLAFTAALVETLRRPAFFAVPGGILKTALGEFSSVILDSQRVIPRKAIASNYPFSFPNLAGALADLK